MDVFGMAKASDLGPEAAGGAMIGEESMNGRKRHILLFNKYIVAASAIHDMHMRVGFRRALLILVDPS